MVSALVGAGGNAGAVFAGFVFYKQDFEDPLTPYKLHASFVLCMAILTPLFYWPEYGSMFSAPAISESRTIRDQKSAQNDGVQFNNADFSPKYMELDREQISSQNDGAQFSDTDFSPKYLELDITSSEVSPSEKRPTFAPPPVAHV